MTLGNFLVDSGLGLAIGLALGLLGGGGSILTVPALVYVVGQTPQVAVTASLLIVGANSVLGALFHRAQGTLRWRVALVFGGVGMAASYLAAGLSKSFSPVALMIMFAVLMLVVGGMMLLRKPPTEGEQVSRGWAVTVVTGAGVGVLTGFLGVGGGFLIVPALVLLVGLPMRQAVGTSLIIIAMNSAAGFLGHLDGLALNADLLIIIAVFVLSGMAGVFIGAKLTHRVQPTLLRRMFAVFVVVLALILLYDNVGQLIRAAL